MVELLLFLDTVMTLGILVGVWWSVFAAHNGDLKEVARTLREFVEKNVGRDK